MQGRLAAFLMALFLFVCFAAAYDGGAFAPQGRDILLDAQKQIALQAEETRRTGQGGKVAFFSPELDMILVLVSPEDKVSEIEGLELDRALEDEMQKVMDRGSVGRLFYVAQNRIKDQRALSDKIEVESGFSARRQTTFLLSGSSEEERPVRIEIAQE